MCVCVRARACVCACVRACVRAYVRVRARVCVYACGVFVGVGVVDTYRNIVVSPQVWLIHWSMLHTYAYVHATGIHERRGLGRSDCCGHCRRRRSQGSFVFPYSLFVLFGGDAEDYKVAACFSFGVVQPMVCCAEA